nr:hypothetical protein [Rodentibacter myodis]
MGLTDFRFTVIFFVGYGVIALCLGAVMIYI